MGSVTISHVIGTTTLIVVFISVTMFYAFAYSCLQNETLARQLQEVADYVSSNLVDLVTVCSVSSTDQLLIKRFEMPQNIGTDLYSVTIVETTSEVTHEKVLMVKAFFDSAPSTYRESVLPWTKVEVWNGTEINNKLGLRARTSISSGTSNAVAWVLKRGGETTIGLGNMG